MKDFRGLLKPDPAARKSSVLPRTRAQLALSLAVVSALLTLVVLLGLGPIRRARADGATMRAKRTLREIARAQWAFRAKDREWKGVHTYGSLTRLGQAGLIDAELASGVKDGYRYVVVPGSDGTNDSETLFWIAADPLVPGRTGSFHLYLNQSGALFLSPDKPIRPKPGDPNNNANHGVQCGCR